MLPNFLVIGVEKAGTTWIYHRLAKHPDIYLPDTKEISFFNRFDSNFVETDNYTRLGRSWYEAFYEDWSGQAAIGDVSPMYMCDADAPARIRQTLPDAKLVVILRNPVNRAYSQFCMASSKHHLKGEFGKFLRERHPGVIGRGFYADQLAVYDRLFGADRIKIFIFEELMAAPQKGLADLAAFLSVDPSGFRVDEFVRRENEAATYKNVWLHNWGVSLARTMRRTPLLMDFSAWLKRTGIYEAVRRWNVRAQSYPPLDPALYRQCWQLYEGQIGAVEQRLQRRLDLWRDYDPEARGKQENAPQSGDDQLDPVAAR